jgi:uncharacterized protein
MKITIWNLVLVAVFVTVSYWAKAQTNNIVIGHIDSLFSKILHEKRKIWVHLPESYQTTVPGGLSAGWSQSLFVGGGHD